MELLKIHEKIRGMLDSQEYLLNQKDVEEMLEAIDGDTKKLIEILLVYVKSSYDEGYAKGQLEPDHTYDEGYKDGFRMGKTDRKCPETDLTDLNSDPPLETRLEEA